MRTSELTGRTPRRFVPRTTDSRDTVAPAPNVLARDFAVGSINRRWVGDITYVPTREARLYLAAEEGWGGVEGRSGKGKKVTKKGEEKRVMYA
jgi:transposase InsO family protein